MTNADDQVDREGWTVTVNEIVQVMWRRSGSE